MKKAKNDATSFKQLDAAQMRKVDGGTWLIYQTQMER